jgi:uncharacterized protein YrrD
MLHRANYLKSHSLDATDGEIGRVKDFYFEDDTWRVRYMVADTGTWLPKKKVLISPFAIRQVLEDKVQMNLSKDQIEKCPSMDEDLPVSRRYEMEYYRYYNWPFYWQGPEAWGPLPRPGTSYGQVTGPLQQTWPPVQDPKHMGDPHLRSTQEVTGYRIQARDGEIGHVDDFVIDDEDWSILYLLVDTRNWWPGKKVLVSPQWAVSVDWHESKLHVALDQELIKSAPEYDSSQPITREMETRLFEHYHRKPYWDDHREAA